MSARVSAHPASLRDYLRSTTGAREDAHEARLLLVSAYHAFVDALPGRFGVPGRPNIAGPLGHCRDVDAYVGVVAHRFETAGDPSGEGFFTLDTAALASIPYRPAYTEARRQSLADRAESELARLRERLRSGSVDETTVGELVATLGWMRHEVTTAASPPAAAAELIDRMGAGDLHEALGLLEDAARGLEGPGVDRTDWPLVAIGDLTTVVALGLEGRPARARRWSHELADRRDIGTVEGDPAEVEGLAIMGAFLPAGTTTFGLALFDTLWRAEPAPADGILRRAYGTGSPVGPMLETATRQPELANGLVRHLLEPYSPSDLIEPSPRFDLLFTVWNDQSPRFLAVPESTLRDVLTAAVDPSLPDAVRVTTAHDLAGHYVDYVADHAPTYFSPEVTEGLATTTQPLLENWDPAQAPAQIRLGWDTPDGAVLPDTDLRAALAIFTEAEGGMDGLARALDGTTTSWLLRALEAGPATPDRPAFPFDHQRLLNLGDVHMEVSRIISHERFGSVVETLEAGGGPSAFLEELAFGAIGEYPGGDVLAGLADGLMATEDREVTSGGNPIEGLPSRLAGQLVLADLAARPELATPELMAAMEGAVERDGFAGLNNLVHGGAEYPPEGNGGEALRELRELVAAQEAAIDLSGAISGYEATGNG